MENNNPILDELMEISPVVAGVGNQNPYTVPPAYFDNLAVQLMLRIALEQKAGTDPVLNISKDNVYKAPDNYFDNLADKIINRIKAQHSTSAKEEIELLSPLLGKIGKKTPFTSPEGYFTDFSDNIVAGVKAIEFVNEELENLSPVMVGLKNKRVYEAPEGYFDTLAETILNKAKQQQPLAKVIKIGFVNRTMRYAAAAVVIGIIAVSGYVISNKPGKIPLADVTKSTLDSVIAKVSRVSDPEIENFLDNNNVTLADIGSDSTNAATPEDVSTSADDPKDLLADISDEELQKYVDQHSETPITN